MSSAEIVLLATIAGGTIFLGLPIGRWQSVDVRTTAFLSAVATGILLFLFWDVLAASVEEVENALTAGDDPRFFGLSALLAGGFAVGLLSLAFYDGWLRRRRSEAFIGPGAASMARLR